MSQLVAMPVPIVQSWFRIWKEKRLHAAMRCLQFLCFSDFSCGSG